MPRGHAGDQDRWPMHDAVAIFLATALRGHADGVESLHVADGASRGWRRRTFIGLRSVPPHEPPHEPHDEHDRQDDLERHEAEGEHGGKNRQ